MIGQNKLKLDQNALVKSGKAMVLKQHARVAKRGATHVATVVEGELADRRGRGGGLDRGEGAAEWGTEGGGCPKPLQSKGHLQCRTGCRPFLNICNLITVFQVEAGRGSGFRG
jgi:hypothetical protein